jgi:hypothetical protein
MMAQTQTPSYLEQYLKDIQAQQPDLEGVRANVNQAVANMRVAPPTGQISEAERLVGGLRGRATPHKVATHYGAMRTGEPVYSDLTAGGGRTKGAGLPEQTTGRAIVEGFREQVGAAGRQAENVGGALETRAEGSLAYVGNLRSLATQAVGSAAESVAAWNRYVDTADQYLQDSAARMQSVTADIKSTIDRYAQTNDSALAHSIQSASYTWLQTNKQQERAIAERYGLDSAEFRDWQDAKRASIGAMVSDLTARAWDNTQRILNTGLGALAAAETEMAQQVNLAQKNSLDALEAASSMGDQFRLQTSAYLLSLAAAENTEWADLASWIAEAPVMAVDATPMMMQLLDLQAGLDAQAQAEADRAAGLALA